MTGMKVKLLRKLKIIQAIGTPRSSQGLVFQPETAPRTTPNPEDDGAHKGSGALSKHFNESHNVATTEPNHDDHDQDDPSLLDYFEEKLAQARPILGENDFEKGNGALSKRLKGSYSAGSNREDLPVLRVLEEKLPKTTLSPGEDDAQKGSGIPSKHVKERYNDALLLQEFEERCPPGGSDKVVLYTTSLRGVRKTFEDCSSVRSLLESYKVSFCERDVSLHREFREELWEVLEGRVMPPRLFIRGRYIGGADEVVGVLNEQGSLRRLLSGIPLIHARCDACANVRFSVCFNCSGSKKIMKDDGDEPCHVRCPECNENGLVKCELC